VRPYPGQLSQGGTRDENPVQKGATNQRPNEISSASVSISAGADSLSSAAGRDSQCELQKAFRQQLREAAAIGRWETDWKAQVKYTVLLGSAEFVAQMRKLLRGDRDNRRESGEERLKR
jgi:hypothetical protein